MHGVAIKIKQVDFKVGSPYSARWAFKEFICMSFCLSVANPCRQSAQTVQHRDVSCGKKVGEGRCYCSQWRENELGNCA